MRGQLTLYNAAFLIIIALVVGILIIPLSSIVNLVQISSDVSNNTKIIYSLILAFFALATIALPLIYSKRQE